MNRLLLTLALLAGALALLPSMTSNAVAQAVSTSLPTTAATTVPVVTTAPTTYPTTYPRATTYPTTIPAYATSVPTTYPTTVPVSTTAPTSYPTVIPGTPPPMHVLTADYLTTATELATDPRIFAPYVSYAYTKTDHLAALQNVGIQTVYYTNPLQPIASAIANGSCTVGDCIGYNFLNTGGTYNGAAAKDCSGNLITGLYGTSPALFANMMQPATAGPYLQAAEDGALAYVRTANPSATFKPVLFVDNVASTLYHPSASPCGFVAATWDSNIATALSMTSDGPYIANALGGSTIAAVQAGLTRIASPQVGYAMAEQCYGGNPWNSVTPGNYVADTSVHPTWLPAQYAEIHTIAMGKVFWCLQRLTGDGAAWIPQRLYTYASFLLTYDPKLAVYQTMLSGGVTYGGPRIFPETQLVPLNPTTTASDVSGYLTAGGGYARTFGRCLYEGNDLGPCCVGVNPSATVTVAAPCVGARAVVLAGDGVFDGGTLSILAAPPSLAPTTGEIAFP